MTDIWEFLDTEAQGADALKEYAHNPGAVMAWVSELMEAEANG